MIVLRLTDRSGGFILGVVGVVDELFKLGIIDRFCHSVIDVISHNRRGSKRLIGILRFQLPYHDIFVIMCVIPLDMLPGVSLRMNFPHRSIVSVGLTVMHRVTGIHSVAVIVRAEVDVVLVQQAVLVLGRLGFHIG